MSKKDQELKEMLTQPLGITTIITSSSSSTAEEFLAAQINRCWDPLPLTGTRHYSNLLLLHNESDLASLLVNHDTLFPMPLTCSGVCGAGRLIHPTPRTWTTVLSVAEVKRYSELGAEASQEALPSHALIIKPWLLPVHSGRAP